MKKLLAIALLLVVMSVSACKNDANYIDQCDGDPKNCPGHVENRG